MQNFNVNLCNKINISLKQNLYKPPAQIHWSLYHSSKSGKAETINLEMNIINLKMQIIQRFILYVISRGTFYLMEILNILLSLKMSFYVLT